MINGKTHIVLVYIIIIYFNICHVCNYVLMCRRFAIEMHGDINSASYKKALLLCKFAMKKLRLANSYVKTVKNTHVSNLDFPSKSEKPFNT